MSPGMGLISVVPVKWEADLLEHTDEDQTWEQLTSLDEDED